MNKRNLESQEDQVLEILRALKKIQYGSVEIIVHASKIVQIETREKLRFENQTSVK
jgi:hypothetical protein